MGSINYFQLCTVHSLRSVISINLGNIEIESIRERRESNLGQLGEKQELCHATPLNLNFVTSIRPQIISAKASKRPGYGIFGSSSPWRRPSSRGTRASTWRSTASPRPQRDQVKIDFQWKDQHVFNFLKNRMCPYILMPLEMLNKIHKLGWFSVNETKQHLFHRGEAFFSEVVTMLRLSLVCQVS